jgi:hypothetical protein
VSIVGLAPSTFSTNVPCNIISKRGEEHIKSYATPTCQYMTSIGPSITKAFIRAFHGVESPAGVEIKAEH